MPRLTQSRQIEGVTHCDVIVTSDHVEQKDLIFSFRANQPIDLCKGTFPQGEWLARDVREIPTLT
ncbi:hypothetical protein GCM10022234_21690 [Aeromicrobium panaciterrae]